METPGARRRPLVRFFSRSSNAFITAAATIVAAVISVYGVRQHERSVADERVSALQRELADTRRLLAAARPAATPKPTSVSSTSEGPAQPAISGDAPAPAYKKLAQPKSAVIGHFTLLVDSVYREASTVVVEFDVLNTDHKSEQLILFGEAGNFGSSRFLANGQEHLASSIQFGVHADDRRVEKQVAGNSRLRATIKFADVAPTVTSVEVLEIAYSYNSFTARGAFEFRGPQQNLWIVGGSGRSPSR